jgi:radical SAM superfamily enzyme YgiQ (UPF0313 family)
VHTGVQRLLSNLDELPPAWEGLGSFEPPHNRETLSPLPLAAEQLHRHVRVMTVLATRGCKFRCHYCPIAAYNQTSFRHKSGQRVAEEIGKVAEQTGVRSFFGCDDNFFNRREVATEILEAMSGSTVQGQSFREAICFGTEATEIDVYRNQDLLGLARDAGVRALYFGIEDLTATLVNKGQSAERTEKLFAALRQHGIAPMAMMMHHDDQPLWTWRGLRGLLNQVRFLRRAGAISCQITLLTPLVGSRGYEAPFQEGVVLSDLGDLPVDDYLYDGNHCICTRSSRPGLRQMNMLLGYAAFYNPLNLLRAVFRFDGLREARLYFQAMGMAGLVKSLWASRDVLWRMLFGRHRRHSQAPRPKYPLVAPSRAGAISPALAAPPLLATAAGQP